MQRQVSVLGMICILVFAGYCISAVVAAARHGVFAWGSLAEYSLVPYVLLVGFVCSLAGLFGVSGTSFPILADPTVSGTRFPKDQLPSGVSG